MSASSPPRLSRRSVLIGSLLGVGAAVVPAAVNAQETGETTSSWTAATTANGWPVLPTAVSTPIEGSGGVTVALAEGLPTLLLGYFLRRYLYEVAGTFKRGDVAGHRTSRQVAVPYESNHLSGTAVEVFGASYPLGASDGLFPADRLAVETILADFEGVVVWGGHLDPVKESYFALGVPPDSAALATVAAKLTGVGMTEAASFTVGMARQTA